MTDVPDRPDTEMAGNGERVPAGSETIEQAEEQVHAFEHRDVGHDMDTDDDSTPSPAADRDR